MLKTNEEIDKEFDDGCNTDNISDPPSDKEWIKSFIHIIRANDREAVREWAEEKIRINSIDTADVYYNQALDDLLTYLNSNKE